jgi:hypothetical protein
MFSRRAQLVGKSVFHKGKVLAKASNQVRFLSAVPNISEGPQSVLTSKEIDQIVNNLPSSDDSKLLIEKLKSLKNDSDEVVESHPISPVFDVEQNREKLNSFLTRFKNCRTDFDRANEVAFVAKLLDLLKNDSVFSEIFLSEIQVADLIHLIMLQSVMKPGGNHCPYEYFELLFSIVKKSKEYGVDIWRFSDEEIDKFFSGAHFFYMYVSSYSPYHVIYS